ncbi:Conserved hypothetical protein [gamma proteobacterium HdN1]|nr:Conserved hypothetical protein [gamma proteobacterium HdN1]
MACIFCDIVAKTAPASIVYEDAQYLAFMDLFPMRPGHTLIIPKLHAGFVSELTPELRSGVFELGNRIVEAQYRAGLPVQGHNLMINDGPAANQHVPHVHLHVIPRSGGDLHKAAFSFAARFTNHFGQEARRRELDAMAKRISVAMG